MLTIRTEQIEALRGAKVAEFVEETLEHLKARAPERTQAMGEQPMRQLIRMGMEQAETHDFRRRGPVRLFIEMMVTLGYAFDTDPQYPWAYNALVRARGDELARADELQARFMAYLATVIGDECRHAVTGKLESVDFPSIVTSRGDDEAVVEEIVDFLAWLDPEKYKYSGVPAMRELALDAIRSADEHFCLVDWAPGLYGALMFLLGHRCVEDPQFPSLGELLFSDRPPPDPEDLDGIEIEQANRAALFCKLSKQQLLSVFPRMSIRK